MLNIFTLTTISALLLANAAQAQLPTFAPATIYPIKSYSETTTIAVADVNNDGILDILTAGYDDTVGVLLGNSNGTFQPATTYSTGTSYGLASITAADINNDNKLDLLTVDNSSATIGVQLGNGNGTFQPIYSINAGPGPSRLTIADVNGDGKRDLITANPGTSMLGISLGNGNSTFQATILYPVGTNIFDVAVADVNSDGKFDLVAISNRNNLASILLGNGNGTFQAAVNYPIGFVAGTTKVVLADVNNDNKIDILTSHYTDRSAGVLFGNGNGTFQSATFYTVSTNSYAYPLSLAVNDMNGDTKPDLLVVGANSNAVYIFSGNGNGSFQTFVPYPLGGNYQIYDIATADVNKDGRPDIITANALDGSVSVLLNTTPLATRAALPGASATLAPNPASDHATLALAGLPAAVARVQATLLDATGRAVGQQVLAASQGTARADVPTAGLAAGLYLLQLAASDAQGQAAGYLPAQRLSIR